MTNQLNTISLADLSNVTGGVAVRNVGVVNDSVVNRPVPGVVGVGVGAVGRSVGVDAVGSVGSSVGAATRGVVGPSVSSVLKPVVVS